MVLTAKMSELAMKVSGSAMHERGLIRLDVKVSNDGEVPLEALRLKARYNKSDLASKDSDKAKLHHLLPGDYFSQTFLLRPRVSIDETILGIKVRAEKAGVRLAVDLDLGSMSINVKGLPYEGGDPIPRM
ncbi:MAG TPA: hypothetical protein EYQ85_05015 [Candidatus Poseidoniales archaeon]|jgi:hypothetical protein|nr:MAG: hypothetical protein CXT68_08040 [Euryarchaeota archaeon]HIF16593.1 hypothetical protein [Candidatus Poseidoniales archaeon]